MTYAWEWSHGKPRGHGMGPEDTNAIFKELLRSRAISSGIMEDIEDFRIFVRMWIEIKYQI